MKELYKIKEVEVGRVLGKSRLADYVINPYIGCLHGCIYCYADYLTRKIYGVREEWGRYLYVKKNLTKVLERDIEKTKKGRVILSSLTDPFQERYPMDLGEVVEILLKNGFKVTILTKSAMIRDVYDVLSLNSGNEVGTTIVTLNEAWKKIEPGAIDPYLRLKTLGDAPSNVDTFLMIGPIIPYINTHEDFVRLLKMAKEMRVERIYLDKLRSKPGLLSKMMKFYREIGIEIRRNPFQHTDYFQRVKRDILRLATEMELEVHALF